MGSMMQDYNSARDRTAQAPRIFANRINMLTPGQHLFQLHSRSKSSLPSTGPLHAKILTGGRGCGGSLSLQAPVHAVLNREARQLRSALPSTARARESLHFRALPAFARHSSCSCYWDAVLHSSFTAPQGANIQDTRALKDARGPVWLPVGFCFFKIQSWPQRSNVRHE